MKKLKDFIKWTDFTLSLKENFDEITETFKEHRKTVENLQNQNLLLLQTIEHQNEFINDLRDRVTRLEDKKYIHEEKIIQASDGAGAEQKTLNKDNPKD